MRRVFNGFARTLVVVSILAAVSVPAEARPNPGEGRWLRENPIVRVVQIIHRFAVRTFGDGLTDPKP